MDSPNKTSVHIWPARITRHLCLSVALLWSAISIAQPPALQEFFRGDKKGYSSEGAPKAKGLKVTFEYPNSWTGAEGKRPNTIYQVTSENGRGLEICNLIIKEIPLPSGYNPTASEIQEMFEQPALRDLVPEGAVYLKGSPTKIEGLPAAWVIYQYDMERAGSRVVMQMVTYSTYFDKKFIQFSCMVGMEPTAPQAELTRHFDMFYPLFQQMANSIVIHNRYQRTP